MTVIGGLLIAITPVDSYSNPSTPSTKAQGKNRKRAPTPKISKESPSSGSRAVPKTFPARGRAPFKAAKLTPRMLPKRGPCPKDYTPSGTYCRPTKSALFAVRRVGPCPLGYVSQGQYCIARDWQARYVFVKALICPSGYITQGKYCVETRHAADARP